MHVLLFLKIQNDFLNVETIDNLICAKFSNSALNIDENLRQIIQSQMIHKFCNSTLFIVFCMLRTKNEFEKCLKRFFKSFQSVTIVKNNEYSFYQRRNDDRIWIDRFSNDNSFVFDNCWIIFYNSYFIRHYQIYINVKICVFVKIVKYIHKYIYKNENQITLQINENDEIARHVSKRYIEFVQIVYELMKYVSYNKYLSIHRLFVHLFEKQSIYFFFFNFSNEILRIRIKNAKFEFMTFFEYNRFYENEKNVLYQNWFKKYVWKILSKRWKFCKKDFSIKRIYYYSITIKEKIFLRILLIVVSNFTNFENLRTVNDILHDIFKVVCVVCDMFKNDEKWIHCLTNVVTFQTNHVLCFMFVVEIIHELMTNSKTLWNCFVEHFCNDLFQQLLIMRNVFAEINLFNSFYNYDFYKLNDLLTIMKKNFTNYEIFINVHDWKQNTVNSLIDNKMNYDSNQKNFLRKKKRNQLNKNQLKCYNTIVTIIDNNLKTIHFFLHNSTNTKKKILYQIFCHHYKTQSEIMLYVTFSNIAILLLLDEQISHFRFKIFLKITNDTICNIIRNMRLYDFLQNTKLIIWNEIFMQNKHCFMIVHRIFTNFMQNDDIFDDILIIFEKNFAQIFSIVKKKHVRKLLIRTFNNVFCDIISKNCFYDAICEFATIFLIKILQFN